MNRETRIAFGVGCIGLGLALVFSEVDIINTVGLGLLGGGIAQFILLPKDNVLPFRKRRH